MRIRAVGHGTVAASLALVLSCRDVLCCVVLWMVVGKQKGGASAGAGAGVASAATPTLSDRSSSGGASSMKSPVLSGGGVLCTSEVRGVDGGTRLAFSRDRTKP